MKNIHLCKTVIDQFSFSVLPKLCFYIILSNRKYLGCFLFLLAMSYTGLYKWVMNHEVS